MSSAPIRCSLLIAIGLAAAACVPERDAPSPTPDAGPPFMPATDAGAPPAPPVDADCVPACGARTCGDDGCGGVCGTCTAGSSCIGGACLASCPANARLSGDSCVCNSGYAPNVACTSCVDDPDGDGCAEHASRIGGTCACDAHFRTEGCGCVEDPSDPPPPPGPCLDDEAECGGGCIADADGDGCPAHGYDVSSECACHEGYAMSDDGCACEPLPDFTAEAFDPASCEGAAMTYADAEARWSAGDGTLGSYQMVFRRRSCEDGACGPWVEIPLTDISWATRASGIATIVSLSGALRLYLQNATCEHHHYLYDTRYNIGASCSGIGATLTCDSYHYPGICESDSAPSMAYPLLGQALRFDGTMTDACLRLQAEVSTSAAEAEAAILVRY